MDIYARPVYQQLPFVPNLRKIQNWPDLPLLSVRLQTKKPPGIVPERLCVNLLCRRFLFGDLSEICHVHHRRNALPHLTDQEGTMPMAANIMEHLQLLELNELRLIK